MCRSKNLFSLNQDISALIKEQNKKHKYNHQKMERFDKLNGGRNRSLYQYRTLNIDTLAECKIVKYDCMRGKIEPICCIG
jgi:hypothetical protein